MIQALLSRSLYPLLRRREFRGKRRLRRFAPLPRSGRRVIAIGAGNRIELDLTEALQRDYYYGLFDLLELRLMRRILERYGGDFVDVGAYIGVYSVTAARVPGCRVLAFEPHPAARAQLERNFELNESAGTVVAAAAGSARGESVLQLAVGGDAAWSTISEDGRFGALTATLSVAVSTVDEEVGALGLSPSFVKIDVEGGELDVVSGMDATLRGRPTLLVEVSPESAAELASILSGFGYRDYRFERTRIVRGAVGSGGIYNALFVAPAHLSSARE